MRELQDVGVQPDLPDKVRDHRPRIHLLNLGRQMALRHPRRPESEPVREHHLLEKVLEHDPLRRHVPIDLGLRDGEEDVELHGGAIV